ncbi:MAG TPA: dTMP kinase [Candidatus Krumholzibacteriaceae bacterium]|nr:dTMP kinase [Candidatus Krumholzibacteriaceae bacterium]
MKSFFITFEGIEGSGKSTVASLVAGRFKKAGYNLLLTREPGGTDLSEEIRKILLDPRETDMSERTELMLYLASRAQLVDEVLKPALAEGKIVLCDRYFDATTAYQGWARGIGEEFINQLNLFTVGEVIPDLTFLLDLSVEEGFMRGPERREKTGTRHRDRLELEDIEFHKRVREGYLRIAEGERQRVRVIDASRDIDSVLFEISEVINDRFPVNI